MIEIPAISQQQQKLMGFLAANPAEARRRGISPTVAREFAKLPKGKKLKQLPKKKKEKIKKSLSEIIKNLDKALLCPGSKIRSKGKGQGLGRGKGKGPMGKPLFSNKALQSQAQGQGKEFIAEQVGGKKNKKLLSRMLQVMNQRNEQQLRSLGLI